MSAAFWTDGTLRNPKVEGHLQIPSIENNGCFAYNYRDPSRDFTRKYLLTKYFFCCEVIN